MPKLIPRELTLNRGYGPIFDAHTTYFDHHVPVAYAEVGDLIVRGGKFKVVFVERIDEAYWRYTVQPVFA